MGTRQFRRHGRHFLPAGRSGASPTGPDHGGRCAGGARTRPDMESGAVARREAGTVGHRRAWGRGSWTRKRVSGDAGRSRHAEFRVRRPLSVCGGLFPVGVQSRAACRPLAAHRPDCAARGGSVGRCAGLLVRRDRRRRDPHRAEPIRAHQFREHAVPARNRCFPSRLRQGARGDGEPDRRKYRSADRHRQPRRLHAARRSRGWTDAAAMDRPFRS
jgi:hypothetical protein